MSQVKNLRAMFEQKKSSDQPAGSSPPEAISRGRSPFATGGTESPRPLSRVQTSFIAVEKDGRIGLQREQSSDSAASRQQPTESESDSTAPTTTAPLLSPLASPLKEIAAAAPLTAYIPVPGKRPDSPSNRTRFITTEALKGESKHSLPSTPRPASTRTPAATPTPLKPVNGTAAKDQLRATPSTAPKIEKEKPEKAEETPKPLGPAATQAKPPAAAPSAKASAPKPAPATAKSAPATAAPTASKSTRAEKPKPLSAKQPLSPAKLRATPSPRESKPSTKTAKEPARKDQAQAAPKHVANTSGTKSAPTSTQKKKPAPVNVTPSLALESGIGFVKPKPKSPTRPVHLPSSLTAHTASSVSKASHLQTPGEPHPRSASRLSTTSSAPLGLRRKSSTLHSNRPRPSIGPPPKKPARDATPPKREKEVDEGFLARMMRPTQASSSRVADKIPLTPPRRPATAQTVHRIAASGEGSASRAHHPARALASSRQAEKREAETHRSVSHGSSLVEVTPVKESHSPQASAPTVTEPKEPAKPEVSKVEEAPKVGETAEPASEPVLIEEHVEAPELQTPSRQTSAPAEAEKATEAESSVDNSMVESPPTVTLVKEPEVPIVDKVVEDKVMEVKTVEVTEVEEVTEVTDTKGEDNSEAKEETVSEVAAVPATDVSAVAEGVAQMEIGEKA